MSFWRYQLESSDEPQAICLNSVREYLRIGFFPDKTTPLHHQIKQVQFSGLEYNGSKPRLQQTECFTGLAAKGSNSLDEPVQLQLLGDLLVRSVDTDVEGADKIYLMASGGKDSMALAWALMKLQQPFTMVHCTNQGKENESEEVQRIAENLGVELILVEDDLVDALDLIKRQSLYHAVPLADIGFPGYVRALQAVLKHCNSAAAQNLVVLDGMGNDAYMGHIPPKRERKLVRLPRLPLAGEGLLSATYGFDYVHYGLEYLRRDPWERMYSGAGFATEYQSLIKDQSRQLWRSSLPLEEKRGLLRGCLFDMDSCMAKGVLAAAPNDNLQLKFPFLQADLANFYAGLPSRQKYDYRQVVNKLPLRKLLQKEGFQSEYIASSKGSFRFNLRGIGSEYSISQPGLELLAKCNVPETAVKRLAKHADTSFICAGKYWSLCMLDIYLGARAQQHGYRAVG